MLLFGSRRCGIIPSDAGERQRRGGGKEKEGAPRLLCTRMWILSIATIPHIRFHMCRQIRFALAARRTALRPDSSPEARYGPTARPTRVSRAARQHDFDARAEHAPDSAGGQNHAGPAKLSRATVGSFARPLGSARSNRAPRSAAVTLRAKARQSLAAKR